MRKKYSAHLGTWAGSATIQTVRKTKISEERQNELKTRKNWHLQFAQKSLKRRKQGNCYDGNNETIFVENRTG